MRCDHPVKEKGHGTNYICILMTNSSIMNVGMTILGIRLPGFRYGYPGSGTHPEVGLIGEADFIVDDHDNILVQQSVRCRCLARSTVYRLIPGEAEGFGTAPAGVVRCPDQRSCLPCVRCNVDQMTSPVLIQVPQQRSDDLGFTGTYI